MAGNGTVKLYLGAPKPYVGPHSSTEDYELRSISYSYSGDDGVAIAAYNDPKTLHSLSPNLQAETFIVLEHAARDPACKVLVWTATGERAFSSGAALRGDKAVHAPQHALDDYLSRGMGGNDMVMGAQTIAFWDFPKPLICAVNGLAVGGGANIALANYSDLVICSSKAHGTAVRMPMPEIIRVRVEIMGPGKFRNARFKWPFSTLGLTPELGSSVMMPYLVGMAKAKEIMMLGEWVSAEDALRLGLCNEVVAPDELLPRAVALATELTSRKQPALALAKRVLNHHLRKDLEAVLAVELETIHEAVALTGGFAGAPKPKL